MARLGSSTKTRSPLLILVMKTERDLAKVSRGGGVGRCLVSGQPELVGGQWFCGGDGRQ